MFALLIIVVKMIVKKKKTVLAINVSNVKTHSIFDFISAKPFVIISNDGNDFELFESELQCCFFLPRHSSDT